MDLNVSEPTNFNNTFNKYLFNSKKQEDSETIEDFANALTRLGSNIGADEHQVIDRFIAGLLNDNARMGILQVIKKVIVI
jgi:hypothetical protein